MQLLQELSLKNGPLCVGLDTDPSYIPENIRAQYESPAAAVLAYNKAIIDRVVADKSACCFKVQIAYYEAMGLEGMKVYSETLKYIRSTGLIAISDIKRGDIGATSDAYARAHFTGDFETDIITINPYMGFDTLQPFTKYSAPEQGGKGAFVLLCTSNPGMTDIEHQKLEEGGLLLERVGTEIERIGDEFRYSCADYNDQTCGIFGAVVGATQEDDARWLRDKYANTFFLIPGVLVMAASGVNNVLITIFLANTVDYGLVKLGRSDESVIFSMQTFVVKLASGIAAFVASVALGIFNLSDAATTEEEHNIDFSLAVPESAKMGLRMIMTLIPIALLVVAFFWFRKKYILTDEKMEELAQQKKNL